MISRLQRSPPRICKPIWATRDPVAPARSSPPSEIMGESQPRTAEKTIRISWPDPCLAGDTLGAQPARPREGREAMKLGVFSLWTDARQHELVYGDSRQGAGLTTGARPTAGTRFGSDARLPVTRDTDVAELTPPPVAVSTRMPRVAQSQSPRAPRVAVTAAPPVESATPRPSRVSRTLPPPASTARLAPARPSTERKSASKQAKKAAPKSRRRASVVEAI